MNGGCKTKKKIISKLRTKIKKLCVMQKIMQIQMSCSMQL